MVRTFYNRTLLSASEIVVSSAQQNDINNIMLTLWNDDGGICNWETAKFGIFETLCLINNVKDKSKLFAKIYGDNYKKLLTISNFTIKSSEITNIF